MFQNLKSVDYTSMMVSLLPLVATQSDFNAIWSSWFCVLKWAQRRYDYGEGWFDWIFYKFIGSVFFMNEFEWILYNSVIPFSSPEQNKLHWIL